MMMRTLLLTAVLALGTLALRGQSAEDEVIRLKQPAEDEVIRLKQPAEDDVIRLKQPAEAGEYRESSGDAVQEATPAHGIPGSWNLSVGTGFSYMKGYGSGIGFFAAPTYTVPLSGRWALHGGLLATHVTGFNAPAGLDYRTPDAFSGLAVFAAASYRMNDRLILHGSGVKQLVATPPTPLTPYTGDHLSLGATYRLGNNITIGATLHMRNGQGYYHTSPFQDSYLASPFGW
jgi:hypothetical protein